MQKHPEREFDYTTLANAIMAYGVIFLQDYKRTPEDDKKANELVGDFFDLAEYGLTDVIDTLRRARAELDEQAKLESATQDNAQKRKGA